MAGRKTQFDISFGAKFNRDAFDSEMDRLKSIVSSTAPIEIKAQFGNVDTGDAQGILDTIKQQATELNRVIVTQKRIQKCSRRNLHCANRDGCKIQRRPRKCSYRNKKIFKTV